MRVYDGGGGGGGGGGGLPDGRIGASVPGLRFCDPDFSPDGRLIGLKTIGTDVTDNRTNLSSTLDWPPGSDDDDELMLNVLSHETY